MKIHDPETVICPKCKANMEIRPVFVREQCRQMLEARCYICGNRVYPDADTRRLVVVDLSQNPAVFTNVQMLALEKGTSVEVAAAGVLESFFQTTVGTSTK